MAEWPRFHHTKARQVLPVGANTNDEDAYFIVPADLARELYEGLEDILGEWDLDERFIKDHRDALARYEREVGK